MKQTSKTKSIRQYERMYPLKKGKSKNSIQYFVQLEQGLYNHNTNNDYWPTKNYNRMILEKQEVERAWAHA